MSEFTSDPVYGELLIFLRNQQFATHTSHYRLVILPRSTGRPDTATGLPFSVTSSATTFCIDDSEVTDVPPFDEPLHPAKPTANTSIAAARIEVRRRVLSFSGNIAKPSKLSENIRFPVPPNPLSGLPMPTTPANLTCFKRFTLALPCPPITPLMAKVRESLPPVGMVSGGAKVNTVLDVTSGASTVEVPICSPFSDAVSVSELKSFGLLTEIVAADTICWPASEGV